MNNFVIDQNEYFLKLIPDLSIFDVIEKYHIENNKDNGLIENNLYYYYDKKDYEIIINPGNKSSIPFTINNGIYYWTGNDFIKEGGKETLRDKSKVRLNAISKEGYYFKDLKLCLDIKDANPDTFLNNLTKDISFKRVLLRVPLEDAVLFNSIPLSNDIQKFYITQDTDFFYIIILKDLYSVLPTLGIGVCF